MKKSTISEIIAATKEAEQDITGIKVIISNIKEKDYFGEPVEVYFGELADIPTEYMKYEIIKRSQIIESSDKSRNGAYLLSIEIENNEIKEN